MVLSATIAAVATLYVAFGSVVASFLPSMLSKLEEQGGYNKCRTLFGLISVSIKYTGFDFDRQLSLLAFGLVLPR